MGALSYGCGRDIKLLGEKGTVCQGLHTVNRDPGALVSQQLRIHRLAASTASTFILEK